MNLYEIIDLEHGAVLLNVYNEAGDCILEKEFDSDVEAFEYIKQIAA